MPRGRLARYREIACSSRSAFLLLVVLLLLVVRLLLLERLGTLDDHRLTTDAQRATLLLQHAIDAVRRAAELVDDVELVLVVGRQPHLAGAAVLVEVLVLHRVPEADAVGALGLLLL